MRNYSLGFSVVGGGEEEEEREGNASRKYNGVVSEKLL